MILITVARREAASYNSLSFYLDFLSNTGVLIVSSLRFLSVQWPLYRAVYYC